MVLLLLLSVGQMLSDDQQTWHVDLAARNYSSDLVGKKHFIDEKKEENTAFPIFSYIWRVILSHTIYLIIIIVHPIIGDPSSTQMTCRTLVRILG